MGAIPIEAKLARISTSNFNIEFRVSIGKTIDRMVKLLVFLCIKDGGEKGIFLWLFCSEGSVIMENRCLSVKL